MACPACGHAGPVGAPECGACGMIFAKWKARAPRAAAPPPAAALLSPAHWAAIAALAVGLFLLRERVRAVFWILDGIDLVIHEAGHPILGLFGWRFLMVAGGTIFQLAFPIAFAAHFYRERQPRSGDACVFWVGQNFLHIGRYAADARAQLLPLVGGGEHDWTYMLGETHLLIHDVGVGRAFDFLGCALIAWACVAIWARTRSLSRA